MTLGASSTLVDYRTPALGITRHTPQPIELRCHLIKEEVQTEYLSCIRGEFRDLAKNVAGKLN